MLLSPNWSCSIYDTKNDETISLEGIEETEIHLATADPTKSRFALAANNHIAIVDAETGKSVCHITGHRSRVSSLSFSSDGLMVASGGTDGALRIWDSITGEELRRFDRYVYPVTAVCFSPGDKTLISGDANSVVYFWSLWSTEELLEQAEGSHLK